MYRNLYGKKKKTYNQIQLLFKKFGYQYEFKSSDVEEIFAVKRSRAFEIISVLYDNDLIEASSSSKFRFKK